MLQYASYKDFERNQQDADVMLVCLVGEADRRRKGSNY